MLTSGRISGWSFDYVTVFVIAISTTNEKFRSAAHIRRGHFYDTPEANLYQLAGRPGSTKSSSCAVYKHVLYLIALCDVRRDVLYALSSLPHSWVVYQNCGFTPAWVHHNGG